MDTVNLNALANVMEREPKPNGVKFEMCPWFWMPMRTTEALAELVFAAGATDLIESHLALPPTLTKAMGKLRFCGTTACVAGHAVIHFDGIVEAVRIHLSGNMSLATRGAQLLGLKPCQAHALFIPVDALGDDLPINRLHAAQMLRWLAEQPSNVTGAKIDRRWWIIRRRTWWQQSADWLASRLSLEKNGAFKVRS